MKNPITLFVSLFFVLHSFAADWSGIRSSIPQPAQKNLVTSTTDQSIIHFSLDGFFMQEVNTSRGPAVVISLDEATQLLEQGAPDLPKMTASVIIPDLAAMQIEVLESSYQDFTNILVAPSKGNLMRNIDPATVPYIFGDVYSQDAFFPGNLADLREPYIVRDYRGQTVIVHPFLYNPVTKTLRVYTDITVKISRTNGTAVNPLYRTQPVDRVDAQFDWIYRTHFLNPVENSSRYTPVPEFGNMLIISYGAFMDAMQPYIDWKSQVGYPVEMVDVGSIGNAAAIKTFIADYYNTNGLTFVLLVGDAAQVPTSSTSAGPSDVNYSFVAGNDHYPDLFVGRFSAENVDQVVTQVQRTLTYEQNPPVDVDWFSVCTGVASNQGPGDDNEYDYQHIRNIQNNKLIPFTYTYANELYDGTQGGNDAAGNPSPAQVSAAINAGTGVINYTGHGSMTSWGTSGFSNSNVNTLTNANHLPFVWSVACVNGEFNAGTCFAEAWLRATNNGQPTGAVAFLGSTINQSWDPPMAAQDEMNDIMVETYPDNINRTFGALSMHGCMLMNDEFGSGGSEMTDTWTCFGDASLMVRTAMPQTMTVTHEPVILLGMTTLAVNCSAEGARATLNMNGNRLATGIVSGGSVILEFEAMTQPGMANLTVTGFNQLPYMADIEVIPADGPYLVMESFLIDDSEGNGNGLADYNETISLSVTINNVGIEDATNVNISLSAADSYIDITDGLETFDNIPAGGTVFADHVFTFHINGDIPDQHVISFEMISTNGDNSWEANFDITANAPILHINSILLDDSQGGNGDGELDPGETAGITFDYGNTGHAVATDVEVILEGQSGFVEVTNPEQGFESIGFFGTYTLTYNITVDEDAPEGIIVAFVNKLMMEGFLMEQAYPLKISAKCEDFETGDFSMYDWQLGGTAPWQIFETNPYEGEFCIKSGTITHNQTSELSISYEVLAADSIVFMRKVSSETNDYLKFYINDQVAGSWSGTGGVWTRQAYAVEPGVNTFKWAYEKNNMGNAGADCAWLDFIVLPAPMSLTIWAGPDSHVCTWFTYQVTDSYGTDYTLANWSSAGSGTFDDNTLMHPVYTPSEQDYNNGSVELTLTLWDGQGNNYSDEMVLAFDALPPAPDKPVGPEYIDVAYVLTSDYSVEGLPGVENYMWHLTPVEAGEIIYQITSATVNWNPEFTGIAYVFVAGLNECGHGMISEMLEVTVENSIVGLPDNGTSGISMEVYPNPVKDLLKLTFRGENPNIVEVSVVNVVGATVLSERISLAGGNTIDLPVTHLDPGIYLLIAKIDGQRVARKVVVE